jgi:hypothetical protein
MKYYEYMTIQIPEEVVHVNANKVPYDLRGVLNMYASVGWHYKDLIAPLAGTSSLLILEREKVYDV